MRETRGKILDGASVALCRRDWRQFVGIGELKKLIMKPHA
jgi:hypothetical protein